MIWSIVFGLCFLLELFWRRGYALWLAIIAGLNAFILSSMDWKVPFCFFVIVGSVALIVWHLYCRRPLQYFEQHPEARSARTYLHRTWAVSKAIKNGSGWELMDDSYWHLQCDQDLPAGAWVKVDKIRGVLLWVVPVINVPENTALNHSATSAPLALLKASPLNAQPQSSSVIQERE